MICIDNVIVTTYLHLELRGASNFIIILFEMEVCHTRDLGVGRGWRAGWNDANNQSSALGGPGLRGRRKDLIFSH